MTKEKFIALLEETLAAVKADDSMEGSLRYQWGDEPDTYNVEAFIRVGNSMGQGGCLLHQDILR